MEAIPNNLGKAADLYIQVAERDLRAKPAWFKQWSNWISMVALAISIGTFLYQRSKDTHDALEKNLTLLSQDISELAKVPLDGSAVAFNRRIALVTDAERLIQAVGDKAPGEQIGLLGVDYEQMSDYDKAVASYTRMSQSTSLPVQYGGFRSLGISYFRKGSSFEKDGRNAFTQAEAIYLEPKSPQIISFDAHLEIDWANVETDHGNFAEAAKHLVKARFLANRFPCSWDRDSIYEPIKF